MTVSSLGLGLVARLVWEWDVLYWYGLGWTHVAGWLMSWLIELVDLTVPHRATGAMPGVSARLQHEMLVCLTSRSGWMRVLSLIVQWWTLQVLVISSHLLVTFTPQSAVEMVLSARWARPVTRWNDGVAMNLVTWHDDTDISEPTRRRVSVSSCTSCQRHTTVNSYIKRQLYLPLSYPSLPGVQGSAILHSFFFPHLLHKRTFWSFYGAGYMDFSHPTNSVRALSLTSGMACSFLQLSLDSWQKGTLLSDASTITRYQWWGFVITMTTHRQAINSAKNITKSSQFVPVSYSLSVLFVCQPGYSTFHRNGWIFMEFWKEVASDPGFQRRKDGQQVQDLSCSGA